jgi:hypothetical protein
LDNYSLNKFSLQNLHTNTCIDRIIQSPAKIINTGRNHQSRARHPIFQPHNLTCHSLPFANYSLNKFSLQNLHTNTCIDRIIQSPAKIINIGRNHQSRAWHPIFQPHNLTCYSLPFANYSLNKSSRKIVHTYMYREYNTRNNSHIGYLHPCCSQKPLQFTTDNTNITIARSHSIPTCFWNCDSLRRCVFSDRIALSTSVTWGFFFPSRFPIASAPLPLRFTCSTSSLL